MTKTDLRGMTQVNSRRAHLDGDDLPTAIARLVANFQACGCPEIEFCHDFQDCHANPLPPHLEVTVFHIVRECVANACRHSKCTRILVGLSRDENSLCVQVQDWGVGIDPGNTRSECFGLDWIWRRVGLLGGNVIIHSQPGVGTCILVEIPLVAPRIEKLRWPAKNGA